MFSPTQEVRDKILNQLKLYWDQHPNQHFGDILSTLCYDIEGHTECSHLKDDKLLEGLEIINAEESDKGISY